MKSCALPSTAKAKKAGGKKEINKQKVELIIAAWNENSENTTQEIVNIESRHRTNCRIGEREGISLFATSRFDKVWAGSVKFDEHGNASIHGENNFSEIFNRIL